MTMNDLVVTSAIWRQDNTDDNVSLPSPTNVDSFLTQSMHERSLLCASSSSSSSLSNNEQDDDAHDADVHAVDVMKTNTTTATATTTTSLLMMPFQKPPLASSKNNSGSSHHTRITVAATQSTLASAPSASSSSSASSSASLIITEYKEDEDNKHHQQQQDYVDEYRNEQQEDDQQDYESNEERDTEESKDQDHNMLWHSTMLLDASVPTSTATDTTTIVKEAEAVIVAEAEAEAEAEVEVEVEANNDIVGDLLLLEQKVEEQNLRNDDENKNNSSSSSSTCSSSSHGLVVDQMESSDNENENEDEIIYYNNDSTDDESNSLWFINTFHRQNKSGTIEGRGQQGRGDQDLSGRGGAASTRTERTIALSSVMNINESSSDDTTIFPKDNDDDENDDENENDNEEVEVDADVEKKVQGSSNDKMKMELEYYDGIIIDDKLTLEDQEEEIILYEYSHSYNWSSSEAEDTIHDKEDEQRHHRHQQHDFEDNDDDFEDSVMEVQEEEEEDRKDEEIFFDACEDEEDENDGHNNDRDRGREKLLSDLDDHCLCLTPQVKGGRARRGRGRGRHHGRRLVEDLVAPSVEQDSLNEDEQIEVEIHPNSNDEEVDTIFVVDAVAKQLRKNKRNNKKGPSTAGTAITIATSSTTRKGCAADALYVLSSLALMECCGTTSVVVDDISGILSDASTTTSASLLVGEEEEPLILPSSVLDDSDKSTNKIHASSSSHPRRTDLSDGRDNCRDEDYGDGSDDDNDHAAGPIVVDHRNSNDEFEEDYNNNNKRNAIVGESGHKKDPPTSLHCVDADDDDDDDDHDDNISVLERQEKKVLEELIHEEDNSNIAVSQGSFDVKQSLLILEDLLGEGEEEDDAELATISFDAVDCDSFSVDAFHDDDDHSSHSHHLLRVPWPPVLSLPATGRSNASFLQGIDVMKGITDATTAIGPVDPPEQISQTSVTTTTKKIRHRDCNGTNFNGFSTSASSSFDVPTLSSSDDFLIPCPPPADVPEANSNTTRRFVPLQLTIGSIAEDSLRKTRKCLPLVPSSPSNRYLLLNTKSNNVDIDDQENCTPRGGQQLQYRSNNNIFKVSDADNNNDSPYFTTSKISVNIEGVASSIALKGIMRKKQEGPIDDDDVLIVYQKDRHQRRVHWDEQQLASKVEKGVMFSSRRGRRSICALDSLMLQITTVQDGYTNELGNHSSHSNDTHGYIC